MSSAFYISAARKSSGKTMMSIGLCRALSQRSLAVQPFKKGPDFIDPMWLGQAVDGSCYNLDFYTSSQAYIKQQFEYRGAHADVVVVEGNKGLYDGLDLHGADSNAAMAKLLGLPVFLVLDCRGMTRGVAPLIQGYQAFDPQVNIAGVILNRTGGSRHQDKLRNVIEHYCDIPILGMVPVSREIQMTERHLGLIPSNELNQESQQLIDALATVVNDNINLDQLLGLAASEPLKSDNSDNTAVTVEIKNSNPPLRIAIARDAAFGFYYPDDLERFAALNVELVAFDSLHDQQLPEDIDALFIGGGFPETHLKALHENQALRKQIKSRIAEGLPCYAECGGLMYLSESIEYLDEQADMVGAIAGQIKMHRKPQGRGYVQLQREAEHPWPQHSSATDASTIISAHEFHHSSLQLEDPEQARFGYKILRGDGITGSQDAVLSHNLVAGYSHLRQTDQCHWVDEFVEFVRLNCKSKI